MNKNMKNKKSSYESSKIAALFLLPFFLFYGLFTLFPVIKGFVMSLYTGRLGMEQTFYGLGNYIRMLEDSYFWQAIGNTLLFVIVSTPLVVVMGLSFAMIANSRFKGAMFVKIAVFLPYVLSISVISKLWVYIFKPYTGLINNVLINIGIIDEQIMWFDSSILSWITILVATLWWTVGFNTILFLAGLKEIPDSLYEASSLDGANYFQQFIYITLPNLKRIVTMIVLLQMISSFKLFGQPWLMTGGGPSRSTRPIVQYIYQEGFNNWDSGYASAMSYALLLIMIATTLIFNKIAYRKGEK